IHLSDPFVPPTTRSESDEETDSNVFNTDSVENTTFDEYIGDNQEKLFLDNLVMLDKDVDENPGENISKLFNSYHSKILRMGQELGLSIVTEYHEILSLSHILLLQTDNFSNLQIEKFSRDTLKHFQQNMCNTYVMKVKVAPSVKAIALDENLRLKETQKTIIRSKSFENPIDQEKFDMMQFIFLQLTKNIPIKPLKDILSKNTLTVNIISPILYFFFHDTSIHPAIWPNTTSMSAKVHKLANLDSSRAKQPDMIGNVVNNSKSTYEIMFREITGEEKNNNNKKNYLNLVSQTELFKFFQTCRQFIDGIDNLFKFAEKYEYEVQRYCNDINQKKKDNPVEVTNWCRATLGILQFKELIKERK
ncbi:7450_t:CDS:2, partial [Ambispora leptoticha]